jgi:hypothetical protein
MRPDREAHRPRPQSILPTTLRGALIPVRNDTSCLVLRTHLPGKEVPTDCIRQAGRKESPNRDRAAGGYDHQGWHPERIAEEKGVGLVSQISSASPLFAVRKRDVCADREADENILFPGESPMPRWGTTTHENDEGIS